MVCAGWRALSVLLEEERANARAITKNILTTAYRKTRQSIIEEPSERQRLQRILADYRELTRCTACTADKVESAAGAVSVRCCRLCWCCPLVPGSDCRSYSAQVQLRLACFEDRCDCARRIFAVLLILYGIPFALICGGAVIALLSCTLWARHRRTRSSHPATDWLPLPVSCSTAVHR